MRQRPLVALVVALSGLCSLARAQDEFDEFDEPEEPPAAAPAEEPDQEAPEVDVGDAPVEGDPSRVEAEESLSTSSYRGARDPDWVRRFRFMNTLLGPTGGVRVVDARSGPLQSFRVQLAPEFFSAGDFLEQGSHHTHVGASLSLSWTVHRFVEVYAGLYSHSDSNDKSETELMLALGDLTLGAKVPVALSPWLTVGGDVNLLVLTGSDVGPSFTGMGFAFRGNATADLRGLNRPFPLIARFNLQYAFDRSQALIESTERVRYSRIDDARPIADETRHLVDRFERFALGINRTDFFNVALGFEAPLEVNESFLISPLLEWTLGIPVNRQGYDCLFAPAEPGSDTPRGGDDGCLDVQGFASFPMDLTLGVRVLPPVRGLGLLLAADIGITGSGRSDSVRELMANAPYNIVFGISYAFDLRPVVEPPIVEREVEVRVEVPPVLPPRGRALGAVIDQQTSLPVPGVTVRVAGADRTAQLTDAGGRFATDANEPGAVQLELTHPDYEPATCAAEISPEGGDVSTRCEMIRAVVVVQQSEVEIREQILFAFDRAEILPQSFPLMETIARVLSEHPELARIEIQGHTDDRGSAAYNLDLSDRRARAVRDWLTSHDVDASRVVARGYGLTRPLVPNTNDENRGKNRRVQFIILERGASPDAPGQDAASEEPPDAAE